MFAVFLYVPHGYFKYKLMKWFRVFHFIFPGSNISKCLLTSDGNILNIAYDSLKLRFLAIKIYIMALANSKAPMFLTGSKRILRGSFSFLRRKLNIAISQ